MPPASAIWFIGAAECGRHRPMWGPQIGIFGPHPAMRCLMAIGLVCLAVAGPSGPVLTVMQSMNGGNPPAVESTAVLGRSAVAEERCWRRGTYNTTAALRRDIDAVQFPWVRLPRPAQAVRECGDSGRGCVGLAGHGQCTARAGVHSFGRRQAVHHRNPHYTTPHVAHCSRP